MSGCNLAKLESWERSFFSCRGDCCVFISHKKEDEDVAIDVGSYLTDIVGVNIYLDIQDCVLKEAVNAENDQKIVNSIQKGLECSSHLLCLVSDQTRLSWWVPYEIGFADKKKIDVAVLKLKEVPEIPSYIKIKKTLLNLDDFLRYVSGLGPYGFVFENKNYDKFSRSDNSILLKHID